jgi:CRP-like cAMP-binding protein
MLGPGDFFGEGCLAGQPLRLATATAIAPSKILVVQKRAMINLLHSQHAFSDRFIAHMLARNIRIEGGVDHRYPMPSRPLFRTRLHAIME